MTKYVAKARRVIDIEIQGLRTVGRRLDGQFGEAVDLMLEAIQHGRKIIVTGVGKSGHVGRKIAATLTSTGSPSVELDAVNAAHGDLGVVSDGDVLIVLSYSGEVYELVRVLPALRRQRIKMIALTGNPKSTVALQADVHLDVSVPREACPHNLAPTASTTAMLAVGDALAMVLLEARGFRKQDFAKLHPGGALGKQLLLTVRNVMRPLDQVPILPEEATVREAVQLWRAKRAGAVIVVNKRGQVSGIFTHGDFVRRYETGAKLDDLKLKQVMTSGPITVQVDKLAVEVLNVFEKHRIDDLVVVDSRKKPVGLVDAQDITKQKIL
jgi:arabinose-5-phosphate isomerase